MLRFTKGHGTQNDFVLIPDPDGTIHLTASDVALIADRRAGIGADGVIRVVPARHADEPEVRELTEDAEWFMDYRNADGSPAAMCGNGTRVTAAYLRREGLERGSRISLATRAGVKHITVIESGDDTEFVTDLGEWALLDPATAEEKGYDCLVRPHLGMDVPGLSVDVGSRHTVVLLPEEVALDHLDLTEAPTVTPAPPDGSNVEFVRVIGPGHIAMRVHERGVGETRSCGTGAAAAVVATHWWAGSSDTADQWTVDVPGGRLVVRLAGTRVDLQGPAALVADGTTDLA